MFCSNHLHGVLNENKNKLTDQKNKCHQKTGSFWIGFHEIKHGKNRAYWRKPAFIVNFLQLFSSGAESALQDF